MSKIDGKDVIGDNGNAEPLSHDKKQLSQRINWHFRFSNYEPHHIDGLDELFSQICSDWIFQEEVGEKTGTPHLQGAIRLKKAMRYTEFTPDKRIHWEPQKSLENTIYCSKDHTRKPNGRIVYGGTYRPKQDLKLISPSMFKPWQNEIIDIINTEPDDRTIHWYWSENGGVGKSCFIKYLVVKHKAKFLCKGKFADIINIIFNTDMDKTNILCFDLPRNTGNKISYDALECIKNGLISNTKYETGDKVFNPPHIFIFANAPPEEGRMSDDKWKITELN